MFREAKAPSTKGFRSRCGSRAKRLSPNQTQVSGDLRTTTCVRVMPTSSLPFIRTARPIAERSFYRTGKDSGECCALTRLLPPCRSSSWSANEFNKAVKMSGDITLNSELPLRPLAFAGGEGRVRRANRRVLERNPSPWPSPIFPKGRGKLQPSRRSFREICARPHDHRQGGFYLVEVMCAILILGIALVGLTQALTTALSSTKESELQTTAALLAAGRIETLRADGFLIDGETEGEGDEGLSLYRWRESVSSTSLDGLHEVAVVVENSRTGKKIYELRTLLFDPPIVSTSEESKTSKDSTKSRREGRRQ